MQRFRWIALQGSSRGFLPPLLLFVFLITTSGLPAHAADDPAACRVSVARIVSIQGTIELLRARQNDWSRVTRVDTPLCEGDRLRTGALSRAALFIQPETLVRVDQNTSISVSKTTEETLVEFTQEDFVSASATAHTCGAGYFITRFPRKFRVNTPHLNAAVEGTEFLVAMRCEGTELSVFEGKVLATSAGGNVFPSQSVVSGQTLTVGGTEPPAIKLQIKPADSVQWTLYYPPITPAGAVPVENCRVVAQDGRVSCLIARAEQLLRAGRVEEAQVNIGDALAAAPYSSDAKALSSIISLVRNDKAEALRLAREAVEATANSASAWLALSYAQQADFKLEAALSSAQRAAELTPSNALANARVAELQLSLGWTREAEKTAKQTVVANPSEGRAHMILGFVHLAQINVKEAREDFGRAIDIDSTDPLSRLGLGLANIRKGKLVEGREQLEIAVALDPTNSLIRSYVGKAYYEENTKQRDELAATQFGIAKQFDPYDPTPWFYEAILKQSLNRPVEALEDLRASTERNDNRAIYRSRLLLDADLAARGASLARVYENLGFEQLALVEAMKSLGTDPANHSAHRFLSGAYAAQPRHEIAQASELLQSQLLQPININPVQPQLPEKDLHILSGAGPGRTAFNEFTPLFEGNGVQLNLTGIAGNNDTLADELVVSGIADRVSYSIGQFHYESEGFRSNNDLKHDIYNLFVQAQLTDRLDVQFEYRSRESNQGDLRLNFDPNDYSIFDRRRIEQHTPRLGLHFSPSAQSDLIVSLIHTDRTENLNQVDATGASVGADLDSMGDDLQAQYLFRTHLFNVTAGFGTSEIHLHQRQVVDISGAFPGGICPPFPPFLGVCVFPTETDTTNKQLNAYVYTNVNWPTDMIWTFGLSHDSVEDGLLDVKKFNPKLGWQWYFTNNARLRLAYVETVKRALIVDQTLEPTQIAGFNQFFDDFNGTKAKRYGIGLDATLRSDLYGGVELSKREPKIALSDAATGKITFEDQQEILNRAYLYWTPFPKWGVRVEYQHERFKRIDTLGFSLPTEVETTTVPVFVSYFRGTGRSAGLFAEIGANFVRQKVHLAPTSTFGEDREDFITVDAAVGYRLPQRRGLLSLEVRNLFDEKFLFQDMNIQSPVPSNPRFIPDRTIFARLTLSF